MRRSFQVNLKKMGIAIAVLFFAAFCALRYDEVRSRQATQQGVIDAQSDVMQGQFQFRVGGKPRAWFNETTAAFKERFGADLIRSHGCCPTAAEYSYDSAYNETMAAAVADRRGAFRFDDAYNYAVKEGRSRFEARVARE